ncbi:MAG: hypothetical protein ABIO57_02480 [Candidatus Paceibacterota bacterium]
MKKVKAFLRLHSITIVLIVLLVVLTIAIKYFIYSFEESFIEGDLHRPEIQHVDKKVTPTQKTSQLEIDAIQSWMTFDYVNVAYKLPANYLKDILGINTPKYPNVRIDTYAKQSNIDQSLLLTTVQHYVRVYQNR